MTNTEEMVIEVLEQIIKTKKRCNEELLQRIIFICKYNNQIDLDANYYLDQDGPTSETILQLLLLMSSKGLIGIKLDNTIGNNIIPQHTGRVLQTQRNINIESFMRYDSSEINKLATVLYARKNGIDNKRLFELRKSLFNSEEKVKEYIDIVNQILSQTASDSPR